MSTPAGHETRTFKRLIKRASGLLVPAPAREFEPSPRLVAEGRRAYRLSRNISHASTFSPRLHRRFDAAAAQVRALEAHERKQFEKGND